MRVCVSNTALVALLIASVAVRTAAEVVLEVAVPEQAPPPGAIEPAKTPVVHDYRPGHGDDGRRTAPQPRRAQPIRRDGRRSVTRPTVAKASHQCDFEGLIAKRGEALVAHIRTMDFDCISDLFEGAPLRIRLAAFEETNMVVVARAALALAVAYDGFNDAADLNNLLYYLQAGVFVE